MQTTTTNQDNKIEEKIKEIIENVSNLSNEALIEFISSMAKFHNYSLHNQLILAYAGASQVASFKKWLELGRAVKKGEKAIYILAPKKYSKKEKDEETGEEVTKSYIKGFIFVPVFDIKQTEGEEIKRGYTTASEIEIDTLKAIAEKLGFSVDFKPMRINRGGYIAGKEIKLNSNLNKIENTGTLVHELAHGVLGHTEEAADDLKTSVVEQEAEMVTALICQEFGIARKSEFYLKSWGTENIIAALPKISKAYQTLKTYLYEAV